MSKRKRKIEELEALRDQPSRIKTSLLRGFAIQFSSFYRDFCIRNNFLERKIHSARAVSFILSKDVKCDLELKNNIQHLVFDINNEPSIIETPFAFEAGVFIACAIDNPKETDPAIEEFISLVSGWNASLQLSQSEMETVFEYAQIPIHPLIHQFIDPHLQFIENNPPEQEYLLMLSLIDFSGLLRNHRRQGI